MNLAEYLKEKLNGPNPGEPVRLIHGKGEDDPARRDFNIDYYPPLLFVTLFKPAADEDVASLARELESVFPESPLLVQDRSARPFSLRLQKGEIPREMTVTEGGLKYYLHPERGQNPGFFIDMRDGRRIIREIAGKRKEPGGINVLNLFAYTCSLSVAALAGGASKVVNIDMNRKSLDVGKGNHRLNHENIPGGYINQALFLPHDIFKSFGRLRKEGPYDLIIADPPPSQKGSFDLRKDYPRLLRRLPDMLTGEGEILLTLNSPEWDWDAFEGMARENLSGFSRYERIPPPEDFRPREAGRGLKMLRISSRESGR